MYILALETTGKYGSASVIKDNGDSFFCATNNEMNHLSELIMAADNAIKQANITKKDLTHIACSIGPGSFTGIRIGVTTARTLSQMLNVPCVEISSLKGMALNVLEDANNKNCKYIASIINARRGQIYAGMWEINDTIAIPESQYMIEDFARFIMNRKEKVYITGDGIDAYEEIIRKNIPQDLFELAPEKLRYQNATSVAKLALDKVQSGEIISYQEMFPKYFRLAEAEQKLSSNNDAENFTFEQKTDDWKIFSIQAKSEEETIGEIKFNRVLDELQIEDVFVSENYRRKHIATQMLEKLVKLGRDLQCKVIQLEVRKGNEPAIKLYEKMGFSEVGTRKEYYQDTGEDAILMDYKI